MNSGFILPSCVLVISHAVCDEKLFYAFCLLPIKFIITFRTACERFHFTGCGLWVSWVHCRFLAWEKCNYISFASSMWPVDLCDRIAAATTAFGIFRLWRKFALLRVWSLNASFNVKIAVWRQHYSVGDISICTPQGKHCLVSLQFQIFHFRFISNLFKSMENRFPITSHAAPKRSPNRFRLTDLSAIIHQQSQIQCTRIIVCVCMERGMGRALDGRGPLNWDDLKSVKCLASF